MKSMKKSMFVTTILMVVLLIVALSTATFAWYTANTSVSVTAATINSAKSIASSIAIEYTAANITSQNSEIELGMTATGLFPMVPTLSPATGNDATALGSFTFTGAPVNNSNQFTANGEAMTPASITSVKVGNDTHSQSSFFVINTNESNAAAHVYAKITIDTANAYRVVKTQPADWNTARTTLYTRDGNTFTVIGERDVAWAADSIYELYAAVASDMRIAMFARTAAAEPGNFTYVGTWGAGTAAATYYGTITQNANMVSSLNTYAATNNGTQIDLGSIAALGAKEICLVAWFDGVGLQVNEAQSAASFTVSFSTNSDV